MNDANFVKKNATAFAPLIQYLDDRSLSLVMWDAKDNGRNALVILREHYLSKSKPKIIPSYIELMSLHRGSIEMIFNSIICTEKSAIVKNV